MEDIDPINTPKEGTGSKWTISFTCESCGNKFKVQTGEYDTILCPKCKKPLPTYYRFLSRSGMLTP